MIGFSTGCLYKNWNPASREAIEVIRASGCCAIEICAGKAERIKLLELLNKKDFEGFEYVSLHLPDDFYYRDDEETKELLNRIKIIHERIGFDNIVIHPDRIMDLKVFDNFNLPLSIENLDELKLRGKSVEDIEEFLNKTEFNFVLDLTHAFSNDNSMGLAKKFYERLRKRLCQIHLSGYFIQNDDKQVHSSLFLTKQEDIIKAVPLDKPIVIESVLFNYPLENKFEWAVEQLKKELEYVSSFLKDGEIVVGGIYQHFKGEEKIYQVLYVARDCEKVSRSLVVYEQLYETLDFPRGTKWVRELGDFLGEKVFPDGRKVKRFKLVREK